MVSLLILLTLRRCEMPSYRCLLLLLLGMALRELASAYVVVVELVVKTILKEE